MLTSPLLRVTTIQVTGCERLDPQSIIERAGIQAGDNILSLDLSAISRRVTGHPAVAAAVIIREIPDRLRIEVQERQAVALVRGHDFYLMDLEGVCFARAVPGEYPGMPIITGVEPETLEPGCTLPRRLTALIRDLHRECRLQFPWRLISEISWRRHTGLSVYTVQGGIQIDLGTDSYGVRIARLGKVLRYLEEKGIHSRLQRIDLTHGDRVFVKGKFGFLPQGRLQQRGV